MVRTESVLASALLATLALVPAEASAWCQMTTGGRRPGPGETCVVATPPDSFPLAWRQRCTSMSLSTFGSSTLSPDQVADVLRGAIATWEGVRCDGQPTGLHVEVLAEMNACERASHFTGDRNVHSVIFVQDGWVTERMHDARAFAVTLVWHDPQSGEIWDADMEINEERGPFVVCPAEGCADGEVDLPNVITHEMGHYFGLAHTPDDALATMWASAEPAETLKRDLQPDDVTGLCSIYPPGALPEQCDPAPRGGLGLDCQREEGCNCSVPGLPGGSAGGAMALIVVVATLVAARRRK
ncbi:hypothetical protein DB32_000898 [Sandaracinus amylolyticus]|uniref:Peptidase M10 metallopeptidase domain-containing protein n=1 Tax=Sandaracinus amylolyticus TaxID=927083 RepID=A0A0F6SDN4_9BACT|nr:hypothetical protein DB32_000898 [Sandaracinus amylolyticus]